MDYFCNWETNLLGDSLRKTESRQGKSCSLFTTKCKGWIGVEKKFEGVLIARTIFPAFLPSLLDPGTVEGLLSEAYVDAVVHFAEPLRKLVGVWNLRWYLPQVLLEVCGALVARVELCERVEELFHASFIRFGRLVGVVRRHWVQKTPSCSAKVFSIEGTLIVDVWLFLRLFRCLRTLGLCPAFECWAGFAGWACWSFRSSSVICTMGSHKSFEPVGLIETPPLGLLVKFTLRVSDKPLLAFY